MVRFCDATILPEASTVAAVVPLLCSIVATLTVGVLTAVPTITVSGRPIVIV